MSEVRDLEHAKVILTGGQNREPILAYCHNNNGHSALMLPVAEIQQSSSGFRVVLFWVCAECARKGA